MLFLALPILACVGFTAVGVTAGSFAALWQSAFGTGPVFNTLLSAGMGGAHAVTVVSTSTSAISGAMFYGIKTPIMPPIMPPPKELEWWETDVFKNVVGLAVLLSTILLIVLRLRRYLHRKN
ncbi:hypothetical protein D6D10_01842 [Aureobasidium pullulans]|uniref:Uncharacterized protein n=1 Tax=Aureobasidium pullulans TaxID=5580 RepID=A0A4S9F8W4_AURPU|nr:hypothetical protein D6D10_01842 [Aureobasidium pullulans]